MGKEIAARQLTDQQKAFALALVATGCKRQAAITAGYSDPEHSGWRAAALPHVQAFVRAELERRLTMEAAPIAIQVLLEVAGDTAASTQARVAAAKTLLDRGGFAPQSDKAPTLDAASMSTEQLKSLAGALHGELATRAKDVTGSAPNAPIIDAEVADILE